MNKFVNRSFVGKNDLVLYIVGFIAVFAGYYLGSVPLIITQYYKISNNDNLGKEELDLFHETMDHTILGISQNLGFFLMLLVFVTAMLALLGILMVHRKSVHDIATGRRTIDWKRMLWGFGVWMILGLAAELLHYLYDPEVYTFNFDGSDFFVLLLLCLILLPIQTTWEEWFFRGYIFQGLVVHTRSVWAAVLVSTLLFAAVHGSNPEIGKYGVVPMMSYYILAGLFLILISLWDRGLELAMGIHFATNLFGASFLSYEGSVLQTATLYKLKEINPWLNVIVFALSAVIFTILARRKYSFDVSLDDLSATVGKPQSSGSLDNTPMS